MLFVKQDKFKVYVYLGSSGQILSTLPIDTRVILDTQYIQIHMPCIHTEVLAQTHTHTHTHTHTQFCVFLNVNLL